MNHGAPNSRRFENSANALMLNRMCEQRVTHSAVVCVARIEPGMRGQRRDVKDVAPRMSDAARTVRAVRPVPRGAPRRPQTCIGSTPSDGTSPRSMRATATGDRRAASIGKLTVRPRRQQELEPHDGPADWTVGTPKA